MLRSVTIACLVVSAMTMPARSENLVLYGAGSLREAMAEIAGTFGNAGRSVLRGPGLFNVDTSLFKRIPIREIVTLQFRAEAFNVLNRANFAYPNFVIFQGNSNNYSYSDSAGQITSTATPSRQIQFALKLMF